MDLSFRPTTVAPMFHHNLLKVRTFADAAESYIENGDDRRYLARVLPYLGDMPLAEIYPFNVRELAKKLLPTQSNSTRNRNVVGPVRAVCYHAYDRGWGPMVRIKSFREDPPRRKRAASQAWLHAFVRQCMKDKIPHIGALVMFMSQTGARISEALELRWGNVDLVGRRRCW